MTQLSLFCKRLLQNKSKETKNAAFKQYSGKKTPSGSGIFLETVAEYCGLDLYSIIESGPENFQTGPFWDDYNTCPSFEERVVVELLHLAYTNGGMQ